MSGKAFGKVNVKEYLLAVFGRFARVAVAGEPFDHYLLRLTIYVHRQEGLWDGTVRG